MLECVAGMLDDVCLTFFVKPRLHVLTLLDQQMLYNNVRTCSRGFIDRMKDFLKIIRFRRPVIIQVPYFPGPRLRNKAQSKNSKNRCDGLLPSP